MPRPSLAILTTLILLVAIIGCAGPEPIRDEVRAVPVRTEAARPGPFQATLTLFGTVEPGAAVQVTVLGAGTLSYPTRFAGGLRTGERVAAGELLAAVEDEGAQRELAEARLNGQAAEVELERARRLAAEQLISEAELAEKQVRAQLMAERLAAAQYRTGRLEIRSPTAGRLVVAEPLPPGSPVSGGETLATVASGGVPRVEARAAAADRDRLRPGLAARFGAAGASSGGAFAGEGEIAEVAPVVDAAGTLRVSLTVTDSTGLPGAGEGVEIEVREPAREAVLTVPQEALLLDQGGAAVFVARSRNLRLTVERRAVTLGGRGEDRVEVLDGLSPGERVVVRGAAFLSDGMMAEEIEPTSGGVE